MSNRTMNIGLLVLRLGLGFMFIMHGYPKMWGGMEKWIGLGTYGMGSIGIHFMPAFWGFMAAFSELIGGIMIMLGIYVRFFSFLLFITMSIATSSHIIGGDGIMGASHAIESAFIFLGLIFMGSGNYAIRID